RRARSAGVPGAGLEPLGERRVGPAVGGGERDRQGRDGHDSSWRSGRRTRGGGGGRSGRARRRPDRVSSSAGSLVDLSLAAGDAAWLAGRSGWAGALLDEAVAAATDPVLHADIQSLRARVMMWAGSVHDAHELMVAESERVQSVDPARAAVLMAMAAGPC